jgi:hypothetical protein
MQSEQLVRRRVQPPRLVWSTRRQALALFARGATVRVTGGVALVVGTILSVVNQASVILGGEASWLTWLRVGVNYLTPFVVASIGYLAGCRAERAPACSCQRGSAAAP